MIILYSPPTQYFLSFSGCIIVIDISNNLFEKHLLTIKKNNKIINKK